jgi:hypothetical protein
MPVTPQEVLQTNIEGALDWETPNAQVNRSSLAHAKFSFISLHILVQVKHIGLTCTSVAHL